MALARHQIKFAIAHNNNPPECSQRYTTTTRAGTEHVASRRHEVPDRHQMAKDLRTRKINNTKASISFGNAEMIWETDAQSRQKDILSAGPHSANAERCRSMKAALMKTHINLGDEAPMYDRVSALPDPTGHIHEYTGVLNVHTKEMIKKSNMYFGDAPANYTTVAQESMALVDRSLEKGSLRGPDVAHNKALKQALTRTNLTFGDEQPEYISDYKRGFTFDKEAVRHAGQSKLAKEVKEELRKTHFQFGSDVAAWETDSMRSQKLAAEAPLEALQACAKQREANFKLKQSLQRTNYEIGTDQNFM